MQCPNCNLNVSDSAKICIHCGMMFSNGTATGVINTVPPQNPAPRQIPNPELPETQAVIDRKRYLQAFTNGKYDSINNSHFSVGTFFLGPVWLLSHKLYKDALKMFGILALIFIIEIALTIFLTLIGALLLVVIIRLVADCIEIKLYYDYCRDFPYLYINNAEKQ